MVPRIAHRPAHAVQNESRQYGSVKQSGYPQFFFLEGVEMWLSRHGRGRRLLLKIRTQRPLPEQRHHTVRKQANARKLSLTLIEDREHLVPESLTERRGMSTNNEAV